MLCTNGHVNSDGAKFCGVCGVDTFQFATHGQGLISNQPTSISETTSGAAPTASIVLIALGFIFWAFGAAYFSAINPHPLTYRLVILSSALGGVLTGVGALVALPWAQVKGKSLSAVLIGVGLILSSAYSLLVGVAGHSTGSYFNYPSFLIQNIGSGFSVAGWFLAAIGTFLILGNGDVVESKA